MRTTTYNQQTYFKGYDARPLKALYLSSPKKELGLELERIGKKRVLMFLFLLVEPY